MKKLFPLVVTLCILAGCGRPATPTNQTASGWEYMDEILKNIKEPVFPDTVLI
ncbi:MAG: hypothetical protein LUD02_15320 [Tannerellaceae bacterium]|nr:hypothetical protein [Tannerellaceae bacterium]